MEMLLQAFQSECQSKSHNIHEILWTKGMPVSRRSAVSASITAVGDLRHFQVGNLHNMKLSVFHTGGLCSFTKPRAQKQGPEGSEAGT